MKPSIGRIVHFVSVKGHHRPAIVVRDLSPDALDLQIFKDPAHDDDSSFQRGIFNDEAAKKPGTWHWPEVVP
jgi:hypothetical protein